MRVVDLVFLHIPYAINEKHKEYNVTPIFEEHRNLHSAVEYFGVKVIEESIIDFLKHHLDDLEMSIELNTTISPKPILLEKKENVYVEEAYITKKIFKDSIIHFYNNITDIVSNLHQYMKIVYIDTESACNSPPIRAPMLLQSA